MKFNTTMPKVLTPYFKTEMQAYKHQFKENNLQQAWQHLERAHIIGQLYPFAHSYVHWKMLMFGIHIKSTKEVLGQIPRLIFGGVKSFVGKIPNGNPGGANVPALKPFPIPTDLAKILELAK